VSRVKQLVQSYGSHIAVPWRNDAAAAQRVIFCVYNENEELAYVQRWMSLNLSPAKLGTLGTLRSN